MKGLVLVLLVLAAAKIGVQQYLVAAAKTEAIVAAYRTRAVDACQRAAKINQIEVRPTWAKSGDARLVIGKAGIDVHLWQFDNALWAARYKNPYLFFTMQAQPHKVFCEFDVVQDTASVYRL